MNNYERLVAEYLNAPSSRSEADRLEFMKISRLDRIADALERISDNLEQAAQSLEVLEQLSEAVQTDRFGTRLYTASTVSGNIQTY